MQLSTYLTQNPCMHIVNVISSSLNRWVQQEGNVLQEPAAAMNLMFPLKGLYNVAMKSVSRKEMFPKFHIIWSLSKITIMCPGYPDSI